MKHFLPLVLMGTIVAHADPSMNEKAASASATVQSEQCATPKKALESLLSGTQKKQLACFDERGHSRHQLVIISERLIKVLEQREQGVTPDRASADANYRDSDNQPRFLVLPGVAPVYLENMGSGWIFPKAAIDAIDSVYIEVMRANLGLLYGWVPAWAMVDIFGIDGLSAIQIFYLFLLIIAGLALRFITILLITHHTAKFFIRRGMQEFEEHLLRASAHIGNLLMAFTLIVAIPLLDLNVHITTYLLVAARLGMALSLLMICYRSVDLLTHFILQKALKTESRLDDQLVPLFGRGLKIVVIIVGGIFVLQNLDVDVTSLLAGVTIGGLAISFAAKDTIANLFGSVTIFADKPFLVGDWIKAADVEGIVEQVGFRSTRIRTFYNSLVTVPNSKFTESVVDNMGARRYRRTDTKLMIPYGTDPDVIEAFCNGIRAIIKAHPKTRKDAYEVHLSEFGEYCLKIMVFYFACVDSNPQEFRCRHEIYLDILRLANDLGLHFALPTQSILVDRLATMTDAQSLQKRSRDDLVKTADGFAPRGARVVAPGSRLGTPYFSDQLPESAYQ